MHPKRLFLPLIFRVSFRRDSRAIWDLEKIPLVSKQLLIPSTVSIPWRIYDFRCIWHESYQYRVCMIVRACGTGVWTLNIAIEGCTISLSRSVYVRVNVYLRKNEARIFRGPHTWIPPHEKRKTMQDKNTRCVNASALAVCVGTHLLVILEVFIHVICIVERERMIRTDVRRMMVLP